MRVPVAVSLHPRFWDIPPMSLTTRTERDLVSETTERGAATDTGHKGLMPGVKAIALAGANLLSGGS